MAHITQIPSLYRQQMQHQARVQIADVSIRELSLLDVTVIEGHEGDLPCLSQKVSLSVIFVTHTCTKTDQTNYASELCVR